MSKTAGDILVETLIDWGVEVIFGLPGDGINGIIEALRQKQDKIRFIQVRHEEAAAFMACGYAKFTGKLGVCIATSGPGGIHLLNGLYDAKMDGHPVLAITGMQFHDLIGTMTQQDVELDRLYQDVAVYNARVMGPAHTENVVALAIRTALSKHGVAHVSMPVDFQSMQVKDRNPRNVANHVSTVPTNLSMIANPVLVQRAADLLNSGKKITILAGQGALAAGDELEQIAEILGAPIVKALLGRAVVPDDSPYTTGGIGLLGTLPSQKAMEDCDTLFIVGSSFPYIEYMPKPGQARAVQIDRDASRLGLRYPVEAGVVGDALPTLQALIPLLKRNENRSFLEKAQKGMVEWQELMKSRAEHETSPLKPQMIAAEIGKQLSSTAITCCDSGTIATWWARHIPVKRGQMHSLSGNLATMANGFPYAIAAKIAYPEREVVAFVGDGGFSMLMAELATVAKYKLNIKVFIVNNSSLGQIKWEQMVFLGNPEYVCDLQPIDFSKVAEACGVQGFRLDKAESCAEIVQQALSGPGAALIDVIVDPLEPPMPAKVTAAQAAHFAESLLRGEPNAKKIALTVMSDKVRELI